MAIPFHDAEEVDALGAVAYLHIEAKEGDNARFGALLLLNARGEPLEFAYNRLELTGGPLWRAEDREQAAVRRLCATLFPAVSLTPALLLCRAASVGPRTFGDAGDLRVSLPVGRIATAEELVGYSRMEEAEVLQPADTQGIRQETHVFWTPQRPEGTAADLWALVVQRGFVLEPFERAGRGLAEAYRDTQ